MSLTKLSLGGNNLYMTSLFPIRESFVSDIPAGDGTIEKLFLQCMVIKPAFFALHGTCNVLTFLSSYRRPEMLQHNNLYELLNTLNSNYIKSLIIKKIEFSSCIKNIRRDWVQSHIWLTASSTMTKYLRTSSYIKKTFLIYDFAPDPFWISLYCIWGHFFFLFYQCCVVVHAKLFSQTSFTCIDYHMPPH